MTPELAQKIGWNYRRTENADLYFISNQEQRTRTLEAVFRISGRVPELWDAATGEIHDAGVWRQEDGRTAVSLRLAPAGSVFVVFRREAGGGDPVAAITPLRQDTSSLAPLWIENDTVWASKNGIWQLTRQSGEVSAVSSDDLPAPQSITGPWTVSLPEGRGAPSQVTLPDPFRSAHQRPALRRAA